MALRKIHETPIANVVGFNAQCKVYRDSEWQEYRVRLYRDGVLQAAADYHTGDKADAISTADAIATSLDGAQS